MGVKKIRRRLSVQGARLTVPYVAAPLTTANLEATNGNLRAGKNGDTIQIGITIGGTAFILSGTAGGGAVTIAAAGA